MRAKPSIAQAVELIASEIFNRTRFSQLAKSAADDFGPAAIPELSRLYHGDPSPPAQYAHAFRGLGAWLSARQFAVFEVYFYIGAAALPEIRRVAFGPYDWIQGNAIEVLCRLAAEGIEKQAILQEIKSKSPDIFYEAKIYAIAPLIHQKIDNPNLQNIIDFLINEAGFGEAYEDAPRQQQRKIDVAETKVEVLGQPSSLNSYQIEPKQRRPWWKFW